MLVPPLTQGKNPILRDIARRSSTLTPVKTVAFFLALLLPALLGGCITRSSSDGHHVTRRLPSDSGYDKAAQTYAARDPVAEARASFARKNYAIYSAMGYARYYPGLDQNLAQSIARQYGDTPIPGTTDAICSKAQANSIHSATSFAAVYNREIVRLLKPAAKLPSSPKAPVP